MNPGPTPTPPTRRLDELGATVVAVSTSQGALYNPDGLDIPELLAMRTQHGDALIHHYPDAKPLTAGEELTIVADVVIPAALQDVIDADLARALPARIVAEGANLPSSPGAQQILHDRGIIVVPDFIANAGGVVAAAVAMD